MDLSNAFNTSQYQAYAGAPSVLDLYYSARGGSTFISFDFLTRTMVTRTGNGDGGLFVTPFAQLDREVLVAMRDKLVELGGTPPELPPETPVNPGVKRSTLNP